MSDGYFNFGNPERQKELLERTLPILEKYYGGDYFKIGIILKNLGITYGALGDHQRAKELLEKALPILENHYREDHFEVAKTLVNLSYIVPFQKGSASVKLLTNLESNHRFIFDYLLADIQSVDLEGQNNIRFDFSPKVANGNFNITISYNIMNNVTYGLNDGTEVKVSKERNLYAIQSTNKTIDEIIESYPATANKLNVTIAVQSGNESILIGHGKCEVLHNNPIRNSHLIGNGGENTYVITVASGKQRYDHSIFSIPQVTIYNLDKGSSIDTLDLRNVVKTIQGDLKVHIGLPRISQDGNDLLVKLEVEMGQSFSVEVLTVRLKNGLNWYQKLNIISNSAENKF